MMLSKQPARQQKLYGMAFRSSWRVLGVPCTTRVSLKCGENLSA
jgi:hypothetical protein